jgi:hypothetical protein
MLLPEDDACSVSVDGGVHLSQSYRSRLCLVTDIEGCSSHTGPEHVDAQYRLLRIMKFASRQAGILWARAADRQDRGDGRLFAMSPRPDETLAIPRLVLGPQHGLCIYLPEAGPAITSNDATLRWEEVALSSLASGLVAGVMTSGGAATDDPLDIDMSTDAWSGLMDVAGNGTWLSGPDVEVDADGDEYGDALGDDADWDVIF